jgi:hypothetical protein
VGILDGFDVLDGSIRHVAGHVFEPDAPTEEDIPEEVEHGLIVHHLAWHNQHRQDDPTLASIYDVMGVVTGPRVLTDPKTTIRILSNVLLALQAS